MKTFQKGIRGTAAASIVAAAVAAPMMVMPTAAGASAEPYTMPQETRLVKFRYDENRTYTILTRPNAPTNIALEPGEKLKAFAVGDTIQWVTAETDGHIFVKPIRGNLFTAGTIVTDKRTYQISLRSSPEDGAWYQRVSWAYSKPDMVTTFGDDQEKQAPSEEQKELMKGLEDDASGNDGPDFEKMNFAYEIKGDKGVVEQAFDDGRQTWVKLSPDLRHLPAVFRKGHDEDLALVNYNVRDGYIVMQGVAEHLVLKLAGDETRIVRED